MRLDYDRERNLLRLSLEEAAGASATVKRVPGLVDMAGGGRLIGVELELSDGLPEPAFNAWLAEDALVVEDGLAYVPLTSGPDDDASRSAAVELLVELDSADAVVALGIPRHGHGYEISYPSGNR